MEWSVLVPSIRRSAGRTRALSLRQEALKNELLRMHQQQLIETRRVHQEELRAQVQRLEQQIRHYELKVVNPTGGGPTERNNSVSTSAGDEVLSFPQLDQQLPGSSERLIAKLVHQNEQIMALLLPRCHENAGIWHSAKRSSTDASEKLRPSSLPIETDEARAQPQPVQRAEDENANTSTQRGAQREVPTKNLSPAFQVPNALSWLPEFEWTDEDERAFENLEHDADTLPDIPGSGKNDNVNANNNNNAQETDSSPNTAVTKADSLKDQKAHDRLESRKRLEALLNASLKSACEGALRKPRWRLEAEAESDDVSAFEPEDAEAMKPLQVFRSAVLAVLFIVHLQKMLMAKELAEKESAMRDFDSMLHVYFDATRMWLGKVVRTPLLSLLQDSSLDVDISTKSGLGASSLRGFAKKFDGIFARRPPRPVQSIANTGQLSRSAVDPTKLLKLKVRLRGILQALSKAIDKKEVPSGILDFWKRLSTDGVYFPHSYQLFNEERQSLEFDALGATRRMGLDRTTTGKLSLTDTGGFSRFNVVMINFLLVRILIPYIILQPWHVGIGSKNIGKQTSTNLANLATLLYCVCRQLSPLPPPVGSPEASFLRRRRSKTVASLQPNTRDASSVVNEIGPALTPAEEEEHNVDTFFMSINEIGCRLISDKSFPSKDALVIQVVREHHVMLQETLTRLHSQLQ